MALTKKKEIVQQLIDKPLDTTDENELMEMLLEEPIAIDSDKYEDRKRTFGDKLADKLTQMAGSWTVIIIFFCFLIFWVIFNLVAVNAFDPYPYILLNLLLSCISALQAPIILMSQNRAAKKESLRSKNDYKTDLKSELILENLHDKINYIEKNQKTIIKLIKNNVK